jgi:hypothetical protein
VQDFLARILASSEDLARTPAQWSRILAGPVYDDAAMADAAALLVDDYAR